jgi:hypothetical protein
LLPEVSPFALHALPRQITCRPLKGDTFDVEVNGEAKPFATELRGDKQQAT